MMFYDKLFLPDIDYQEEIIEESDDILTKSQIVIIKENYEMMQESILGSFFIFLKKIFNFVIETIIKLWHKLVDFISLIIKKIKDFLGFKSNKDIKLKNQIKISFIDNLSTVKEKSYSNFDLIINDYKYSLSKINSEVNTEIKRNLAILEKAKKFNLDLNKNNPVTEKSVYMDQNVHTIKFPENHNKEEIDPLTGRPDYTAKGVFQDKSLINIVDDEINILKIKDLEMIQNIQAHELELYNIFKSKTIQQIKEYLLSDNYIRMYNQYKRLGCKNVHTEFLMNFLNENNFDEMMDNNAFPIFKGTDDEKAEQIRLWAKLTINKHKAIIERLQNMIVLNHLVFHISRSEAINISDQLGKEDFDEFIKIFRETPSNAYNKNFVMDTFINTDKRYMDFSSLGLGKILYSVNVKDDGIIYGLQNPEFCRKIFDYITRYDMVVIAHGYSRNVLMTEWADILRSRSNSEYKMFMNIYKGYFNFLAKELKKPVSSLTVEDEKYFLDNKFNIYSHHLIDREIPLSRPNIYGLRFRDLEKYSLKNNKRWYCDNIFIPKLNTEMIDVEVIIHYLIQTEKCKRILFLVCNPGGTYIKYKSKEFRKVTVVQSTRLLSF